MIWVVYTVLLILAALILTVALRTMKFVPPEGGAAGRYTESDDLTGAEKLAAAVRVQTISSIEPGKTDEDAFRRFHALLEELFPLVHRHCEKTVINGLSLVYCLRAKTPASGSKPALFTAHMDVVPVEEGTENDWIRPPFSGELAEGYVWGRGTLDTKGSLITSLEALERLLEKGFSPARDIYFAFGHDEEVTGMAGASMIAEYFGEKGLTFDFLLDEGGGVVTDVLPGIAVPLAMVGLGEKGFANIKLSVTMDGGHASMPARHTSLGVLSKALCRLEDKPFKPRFIPCTRDFMLKIGPYMKGVNRVVLANLWLFEPLFLRMFSKTNIGGAMLRTTIAVTMAQGSPAPNVVPQKSTAIINSRILPGDTTQTLLKHIERTLEGLPVEIEELAVNNPSALSPSDCEAFRLIENQIKVFCNGAIAAPYLVMAGTDARKYERVCQNIYRFTPYIISSADIAKIHGTNENISIQNVNRCIDFYAGLMESL